MEDQIIVYLSGFRIVCYSVYCLLPLLKGYSSTIWIGSEGHIPPGICSRINQWRLGIVALGEFGSFLWLLLPSSPNFPCSSFFISFHFVFCLKLLDELIDTFWSIWFFPQFFMFLSFNMIQIIFILNLTYSTSMTSILSWSWYLNLINLYFF